MLTGDKIKDIDERILKLNNKITDLEETKINLIILKREIHMDDTKETLKQAFEETMKNVDEQTRQEVYNRFERWN
tara:strand:+ start:100 stop:324 length:225 start_codon:yes stop_codon:yes gene_type:complete